MPKLTEVYSSSGGFLKASDIAKPLTVTIASSEVFTKDYGDGKGERSQVVLSFVDHEKKLGLNFGNANDLSKLIESDNTDDWAGVRIKLHVKNEKIGNEMKDVIRIWPELPEQVTPEPTAEPTHTGVVQPVGQDEDIPF